MPARALTRVLFLTESFHPVLGGGERHIRILATRLAASGIPSMVVTRLSDPAWPTDEVLDGVRVLRVSPAGPGRSGKYKMVPAAMRAMAREAGAFDLVVVRGTRVLGLPGLAMARLLGKPVVLQAEVNGEMSGEVFSWGTRADRGFLRRLVETAVRIRNPWMRDADAFVAMSRQIRDEFLAAGVPETRIALIPHGVDTGRLLPPTADQRLVARDRLGLSRESLIVTFTGRLLRGKGLETLAEAFALAARDRPELHLVLVGSGSGQSLSIEEWLRQRVLEPDLASRVTLAGRVDDVREHLFAADIFAFPSVFEALGLSILEAAACGLACIGSRTGGIVDVIEHQRSGLLVTPGSVEDLKEAIEALADHAEKRRDLGGMARAVAKARFDFEASFEVYRGLFTEITRRAGACSTACVLRGDAILPRSPGLPA